MNLCGERERERDLGVGVKDVVTLETYLQDYFTKILKKLKDLKAQSKQTNEANFLTVNVTMNETRSLIPDNSQQRGMLLIWIQGRRHV